MSNGFLQFINIGVFLTWLLTELSPLFDVSRSTWIFVLHFVVFYSLCIQFGQQLESNLQSYAVYFFFICFMLYVMTFLSVHEVEENVFERDRRFIAIYSVFVIIVSFGFNVLIIRHANLN